MLGTTLGDSIEAKPGPSLGSVVGILELSLGLELGLALDWGQLAKAATPLALAAKHAEEAAELGATKVDLQKLQKFGGGANISPPVGAMQGSLDNRLGSTEGSLDCNAGGLWVGLEVGSSG